MPYTCLLHSHLLDLPSSPADFGGLPGITGARHHRLDGLAQQQPWSEKENRTLLPALVMVSFHCHLDTIWNHLGKQFQ